MQEIHGIEVEAVQCILCMGCRKDETTLGRKCMGNIQSADAVHFNIQKDQIRFAPGYFFQPGQRFAESSKFQSAFSFAKLADDEQCNRFVVNSDTSQLFHRS